jgi:hypothetical protein
MIRLRMICSIWHGTTEARGRAMVAFLNLNAVLAQILFGQDKDFLNKGDEVRINAKRVAIPGESEHTVDDNRSTLTSFQNFSRAWARPASSTVGLRANLA